MSEFFDDLAYDSLAIPPHVSDTTLTSVPLEVGTTIEVSTESTDSTKESEKDDEKEKEDKMKKVEECKNDEKEKDDKMKEIEEKKKLVKIPWLTEWELPGENQAKWGYNPWSIEYVAEKLLPTDAFEAFMRSSRMATGITEKVATCYLLMTNGTKRLASLITFELLRTALGERMELQVAQLNLLRDYYRYSIGECPEEDRRQHNHKDFPAYIWWMFIKQLPFKAHFQEVIRHRGTLNQLGQLLAPILHPQTMQRLEFHDLSKFTLEEAIGYAIRFHCSKDTTGIAIQAQRVVEASLRIHKHRNEHHHHVDDGPSVIEEWYLDCVSREMAKIPLPRAFSCLVYRPEWIHADSLKHLEVFIGRSHTRYFEVLWGLVTCEKTLKSGWGYLCEDDGLGKYIMDIE